MASNIAVAYPHRSRYIVENAVRYAYLPSMLLGINGLGLWLAARHAPKIALITLLLAAISWSFIAERLLPYEQAWNRSHGDGERDAAHALVNEVMQLGSLLLLPTFVGWIAVGPLWPTTLPFVAQVVIAVVVLDAGITFGHYASHRHPTLWRFHAVHHSVERFYGFNGLMKHPLHQLYETALGTAPLLLIGIPTDVATALIMCVAVQLLLQHSNVDYAVGPLRHLLALNRLHRFHHLRWPGIGDVNFGLFTTLWDRVLGTATFDATKRFTSLDLGIDKRPSFPARYLDQLVDPFRPHGTVTRRLRPDNSRPDDA